MGAMGGSAGPRILRRGRTWLRLSRRTLVYAMFDPLLGWDLDPVTLMDDLADAVRQPALDLQAVREQAPGLGLVVPGGMRVGSVHGQRPAHAVRRRRMAVERGGLGRERILDPLGFRLLGSLDVRHVGIEIRQGQ